MHKKDIALSKFSMKNLVIKDYRLCFGIIWLKKKATKKRKKRENYKCIY